MKVDVASTGTLAVDYFGFVPVLVPEDGKTMAKMYEYHPGGVAGNVITQLARLGCSAGWFGKIGDDDSGKILLDEFRKLSIATEHVEIIKGKNSMFCWILVDEDGNRSITMFPNVLNELTPEDVRNKHADIIRNAKILMVEACVMPLAPMLEAMRIANEAGVRVVFDMDVTLSDIKRTDMGTEDELHEAISRADVFIPCKAAAQELLGTADIKNEVRFLQAEDSKIVAVTLGDNGCVIYANNRTYEVPGYEVEVVDTTGAGDAFHGGFVYGLLNNFSIEATGAFANACGAFCCTGIGARFSGTLKQINAIISSNVMSCRITSN